MNSMRRSLRSSPSQTSENYHQIEAGPWNSRSAFATYAFQNTSAAISQNIAVHVFRNLPRVGDNHGELALSSGYLVSVLTTAIIPFAVGVLLACIWLLFIMLMVTHCAQAVESRNISRGSRKITQNFHHLTASALLTNALAAFIALCVLGVIVASETLLNLTSVADGVAKELKLASLPVLNLAFLLYTRFETFPPSNFQDQFLATSFQALQDYLPPLFPDLIGLTSNTSVVLDACIRIFRDVSKLIIIVFAVLTVFCILHVVGIFLMLWDSYCPRQWKCCRLCQGLAMCGPLLLCWFLLSLWTGAGMLCADSCLTIHEYREELASRGNSSMFPKNVIAQTGLTCPSQSAQSDLDTAIASLTSSPFSDSTLSTIFNVTNGDFMESLHWVENQVGPWLNCSAMLSCSAEIEYLVCGSQPSSVIGAVYYSWIGYLLFCSIFTVMMFLYGAGVLVTWSSQVWLPMCFADERPEEDLEGEIETIESASTHGDDDGSHLEEWPSTSGDIEKTT